MRFGITTTLTGLIVAGSLLVYGCDEDKAQDAQEGTADVAAKTAIAGDAAAENPQPAEAKPEPEAKSPTVVCGELIAAIKSKNLEDVMAACSEGAANAINQNAFEGMAASLGDAVCGEAVINGAAAVVTATAGDQVREIPFVKVENDWKFDVKAYAEKYPPKAVEKSAKKGKKGKRGKKRGKKRRRKK